MKKIEKLELEKIAREELENLVTEMLEIGKVEIEKL